MPSWNIFQIPERCFSVLLNDKLVVDIQHFRHLCQLEDEYAQDSSEEFDKETPTLSANTVIESPKQKWKRFKKDKYGPNYVTNSAPTANMVVKPTITQSTSTPLTTAGFPNKSSNGKREIILNS